MTDTMAAAVALEFDSFGQGPPLIILHGLFGSARNWQSIAKILSASHTVHALDLRNHGRSPHAADIRYTDLCADVIHFMDQQNIAHACLLGHSLGGKTAMEIALTHGDRVNHLIVVDISPVAYQHSYDELLHEMRSLPLASIKRRADADQALRAIVDDSDQRLFLLQNLIFARDVAPRWRINLSALQAGIGHLVSYAPSPDLGQFGGKVDVIRGADSDYVLDSYLPEIKALFPAYRLHTIEEAGHWPHAQNPKAFIECLKHILDKKPI